MKSFLEISDLDYAGKYCTPTTRINCIIKCKILAISFVESNDGQHESIWWIDSFDSVRLKESIQR